MNFTVVGVESSSPAPSEEPKIPSDSGNNNPDNRDQGLSYTTTENSTGSWATASIGRLDSVHQISFSARPTSSSSHILIGFANGQAEKYIDMPMIVRFHENGRIDARDGGAYRAENQVSYRANNTYNFRIVADFNSKRYQAFVKEGNGQEIILLSNAAFRSEQSSCLLYTSPSPRDQRGSRMPSSA